MTMPTLIVEIGFTAALTGTALHLDDGGRGKLNTGTLAADTLFTDVTQYVTSVNTRRGATRADGPYLRYEAGTCTISFRNDDRRFDPSNLSGPYVAGGATQVEPLRAVRIRATWGGRTWSIWRGFTDQWSVAYDGPNTSTASVTCFDAFGVFTVNNRVPVAAVGAGETSGARVTRILDGISWPAADRMVSTGDEALQATTLDGNVLSELQLVADTELGEVWICAEGHVVFRSRSAGYNDYRSAYPYALFGDQVQNGVDTTVNMATNPSVENDTTGWAAGGTVPPTIARSSTRAQFGTRSLLTTWGAGGTSPAVTATVSGLYAGREYTASVYVWVPSGSLPVSIAAQGVYGTTSSTFNQWERLTWTGSATSTSLAVSLWPAGTPVGGEQVYADGLQVEEGTTATAYVDGAQPDGEWDGLAHESTSRRLPELPYADATLDYDALSITNTYRATRDGGTEQFTADSGSVSAYLTRSFEQSGLLMQTDAEALIWAEQLLARTALPELRFASLELKPSRDPDRLWPQAFGREIGDRLRIIKRPPGGGAPILREAWVRGVEHRLPADQNWETTLVLEQARDVVALVDNFNRVTSNSWGTAYSGQVWTTTGGAASDYSTTGTVGRHTHTAANSLHHSLVDVGSPNAEVLASVTIPLGSSAGAPVTSWLVARCSDPNNYYTARLDLGVGTGMSLILTKRTGGLLAVNLASAAVGTHTAGATWRIRFNAVGSLLRAKAWLITGVEPASWQVTVTDAALTTGTQVGLLSRFEVGNTNTLPQSIDWDNLAATSLRAWT